MNERFTALMAGRDMLLDAAKMLRRQAEAQPAPAEASAPAPSLDLDRVRETFEDLAEQGLVKKATIEPAMERIKEEPTLICDVIRNIGVVALEARKAASESTAAEAPGTLVNKTAESQTRRKPTDMSALFAEAARGIEARVASRKG